MAITDSTADSGPHERSGVIPSRGAGDMRIVEVAIRGEEAIAAVVVETKPVHVVDEAVGVVACAARGVFGGVGPHGGAEIDVAQSMPFFTDGRDDLPRPYRTCLP